MVTSSLQRAVNPADLTPENLAGNPNLSEHAKVEEMSKRFEAILVRQILNEAQKPVFKSSMALGSSGAAVHQDMMVNQMANCITSAGGLGLAKQLTRDLTQQFKSGRDEAACEAHARLKPESLSHPQPLGSNTSARWNR